MRVSIYTDGSWTSSDKLSSYGGIVLINAENKVVCAQRYKSKRPEIAKTRNHGGELLAAIFGIRHAIEYLVNANDGEGTIDVYYDYQGVEFFVEKWAFNPKWSDISKVYYGVYHKLREQFPNVKIVFHKVPAHSGVYWNEVADSVAGGVIPAVCEGRMLDLEEY